MKQLLGPLQEAWVQALESGKYSQTKSELHSRAGGFCCLGVAVDISPDYKWDDGDRACPVNIHTGAVTSCAILPVDLRKTMAFRGLSGTIAGEDGEDTLTCLTHYNDSGGWDFPTIAKFVREDPSRVFIEPR